MTKDAQKFIHYYYFLFSKIFWNTFEKTGGQYKPKYLFNWIASDKHYFIL